MDFLTLLGELDETAAAPVDKPKRHRPLWVAAAACFCACLLGFSAWFFLPPMGVFHDDLCIAVIRVDDRLISYEILDTDRLSPFERMLLPDEAGEVLVRHKDCTFYRVAGESDLFYLIMVDGEGKTSVLEYEDYVPTVGMDMTDSLLTENGWFTDEDIAALNGTAPPTLGEILSVIYGVTSGEDLGSIRFEKSHTYRGGVEEKVKVPTVTVKDEEALERLYRLISAMTPLERDQTMDLGTVTPHDDAYLEGEAPLSAQTVRRMVLTSDSGHTVIVYYSPTASALYLPGGDQYTVSLSQEDNEWLIALAKIDMAWRDWGTEKEPTSQKGDGCETATVPEAAVTEKPIDE
jgi:hypothetical protein